MITKMTGLLTRVLDDEVRIQIGGFEYQLLVSESVRRHIQLRIGQEVTFHVTEYLEGNGSGSRFIPRRLGFNTEAELDFFDLFCTVEKIGAKKALKAMARPVKEIADAISRQDARWLSTLPGIGATTAEQIVTTLKRKVTKFAMLGTPSTPTESTPEGTAESKPSTKTKGQRKSAGDAPQSEPAVVETVIEGQIIEDVYQTLLAVGLTPIEARNKLDTLLQSGTAFKTVQDALSLMYSHGK
jgi:Holliday junction DNA helicase RuvA